MTVPVALGGGLRSAVMINENAWNTGKVFTQTGIVPGKCFQRVGTAYTLTVPFYYSGTIVNAEVQIINADTSAVVAAWATLAASPTGNAGTGTVSVPQGGPYTIQVRKSNDTGNVISSYSRLWVGIGILMIGQSNTEKLWGSSNITPTPPSAGVFRYAGGQYTGWYPSDLIEQPDEPSSTNGIDGFGGDGATVFMNTIAAATGLPVFSLQMAIGSTTITTWQTAANGGTHTSWDNLLTQSGRVNGCQDFEIVYWQQGETDAVIGTAGATYKTGMANVESQCGTLSGRANLKYIIGIVGNDGAASAANNEIIRQAQLQYCDTNASGIDSLTILSDQIPTLDPHYTVPQYIRLGYRAACEVLFRMGLTAAGMKGPIFTGTLTASAATQTITLPITQDAGSALRDSSGGSAGTSLTGFRAFNNVTAKTISSTAFSGNNIVLTLAGGSFVATDTIKVDYLYGQPTLTNVVYDNNTVPGDTLGRPLQPTRGQISGTAGA